MYSPKIKEDLIPVLYWEARNRQIPMTKLVDLLLRQALTSESGFTYADNEEESGVCCVAETQTTEWKEDNKIQARP